MLCTEVQGNINDPSAVIALQRRLGGAFDVDPVDFEWDEVRGRIHRKRTVGGRDLGIRLGDWVTSTGLADGDVLGCEPPAASGARPVVIAVRLLSARCLAIDIDALEPLSLARVAWEVGNMHAPLFRGDASSAGGDGGVDSGLHLLAPYSEPLERVLSRLPGVRFSTEECRLDPALRLSSNGISTVVRLDPNMKIVVHKRKVRA